MEELAISVEGAVKRFGPSRGLVGLDLAVREGAVFGLLGPNGAGKTTTLRVLLGLLRVDSGSARVLGVDPAKEPARVRASVGVLLEHDGLYDRLSAQENLLFFARAHHLGAGARPRIEELLRSFGLWERRADAVVAWSRGMRQKLAIARSLLQRPRLVLLDEPFSGLDPGASVDLRARLVALAKDGTTVLLTTHDLAHVEQVCDEVAVLQAGRIVAAGRPSELGKDAAELEVAVEGEGLTEGVLDALRDDGLVTSYRLEGKGATLRCPREARPKLGVELVRRGVALEELHVRKNNLERAFLAIVAEAAAPPASTTTTTETETETASPREPIS